MENASKALIIAGAILLAIAIISLGLIVVNNTRGVADSANLSEQEIQAFNAKFTPYEGSNKTGTQVKTLLQAVIASNQANGTSKQIAITGTQTTDATNTTNIKNGGTYTVKLSYGTNGLVNSISID